MRHCVKRYIQFTRNFGLLNVVHALIKCKFWETHKKHVQSNKNLSPKMKVYYQ